MNRRSILIPVAVLAATVAVSPASAADGNGWQSISPFANFTNAMEERGAIREVGHHVAAGQRQDRAGGVERRRAAFPEVAIQQRRRGRIGGGGVGRPRSYVKQLPRCW